MFFMTKMRVAAGTAMYNLARGSFRKKREKNCFHLRGFEECFSDKAAPSTLPSKFDFCVEFTEEEQNTILQIINTGTIDQLKSYKITEPRIKKLIAHRDKNAGFKTLTEVLLFQGIDFTVLDRFCKSILQKKQSSKISALSSKFDVSTSPLKGDAQVNVQTSTGIWVCDKVVSWAQLDTSGNLLEWDIESIGEISIKDGLVAVVDSVARILSRLKYSDVYVMESDHVAPFTRINSRIYYQNLQRQQINASIVSILGRRQHQIDHGTNETHSGINNIYMMRPHTPARMFNLLIGGETVSAENIVRKLTKMKQEPEAEQENRMTGFVKVHPDLKIYYKSRDNFQREQMNRALLLIVAFVSRSEVRSDAILNKVVKGCSS